MIVNFLVLLLSAFCCRVTVQAIDWQSGDNGQVQWALECDFNGNDIGNTKGRSEQCGSACLARGDCASFAWTGHEGGTCWLKNGGDAHYAKDTTCGKIVNRNSVKKNYKTFNYSL